MTQDAKLKAAEAALVAHEAWEADVIMNGDWSGETVRLTQAQHDALTVVQEKRNAALLALRAPEAAEPAPSGAVRVKPLEWSDEKGQCRVRDDGVVIYYTTDETLYEIRRHETPMPIFMLWRGGVALCGHDTRAKAKEAAQADYEQRILAAIEHAPSPAEPACGEPAPDSIYFTCNECKRSFCIHDGEAASALSAAQEEAERLKARLAKMEEALREIDARAYPANEQQNVVEHYNALLTDWRTTKRIARAALAQEGRE